MVYNYRNFYRLSTESLIFDTSAEVMESDLFSWTEKTNCPNWINMHESIDTFYLIRQILFDGFFHTDFSAVGNIDTIRAKNIVG